MAVRTRGEHELHVDGVPAAVSRIGPFSASTVVVDSAAVLTLAGRVDLAALPACRRAVDDLLRKGVVQITVDLQVAHFDDESIALLALMRRYATRHGARFVLADIPPHVARVLHRTGVAWLYRTEGEHREDERLPADGPARPVPRRRRTTG